MTMDKTAINGAAIRFRAVMDEHYELLGDFFTAFRADVVETPLNFSPHT